MTEQLALVTYASDDGLVFYSEVLPLGEMPLGEWRIPFPNTKEESTAFGLVEALLQSDMCPAYFHRHPIVRVRVCVREEKNACSQCGREIAIGRNWLVAMTGVLGTMLFPLVMGLAAIPAYLLYRF